MSRLDDIIDYADEFGSIRADEARYELKALRSDLAAARRERDEARSKLSQADALAMTDMLTPRRCLTCSRDAARKMRDACAEFVQEFDLLYEFSKRDRVLIFERDGKIAAAIRALPLADEFADCNPLKPEIEATR